MALEPQAALLFLPLVAPICVWVAWSDMATMKIPNLAVLALVAVFLVVGPFALPLDLWAMGWLQLAGVLLVGFVLNLRGALGAGDAKFAAAAAPFVAAGDVGKVMMLLASVLLAAFATHRLARAVPLVRQISGHWQSWSRNDFPMGLALGGTLLLYLALAVAG